MNEEHHDPALDDSNTVPPDPESHHEAAASTDYESFPLIRIIDNMLGGLKGLLSSSLVHTSCAVLARLGMWAVLLAAAIMLVTFIVIAA